MKAPLPALRLCIARFGVGTQRAPLLAAAFAGIGGIILVDRALWIQGGVIFLAGALTLFLFRSYSRPQTLVVCGCLVAMVLLGWRHQHKLSEIAQFPFAEALAQGQSVHVRGEGWVADAPVYGARSVSTTIQLDSVEIGSHRVDCDHLAPAWIQKLPEGLVYGSRIQFTGRLIPLEGRKTPGGFDARDFYFRQSSSLARLEIGEGDICTILPGRSGSALIAFAQGLRSDLERGLLIGIPEAKHRYAHLIAAMALGARENSPEDLEELFRISGTLHLFAVSGMNVAVIAGLFLGMFLLFRVPRQYAVIVVIPLVLFYAILTGLSPSAIRAALMFSAFLAAYALREKPRLLNSLGLAALLILLFDSQQLFLPGFQLSFAVLLFIALLGRWLHLIIAKPFLADPFLPKCLVTPLRFTLDRFTGFLAASLAISIASWLGSVGFLAWHFQSISMVGIVANVFMVPLAGIIISLATISLTAFGFKFIWITFVTNKVNVLVTVTLTGMAQFFAGWPGATLNTGELGRQLPDAPVLRADIMGDRGEGSILLSIPQENTRTPLLWMIDSGGPRTYRSQVLPLLRSRGINRLDALILTHGDQGHIGAAPAVLSQFRPSLLLESVTENRSPAYPEISVIADALGTQRVTLDRGRRITMRAGVVCTVLSPSGENPGRLADDRALVLKLSYEDRTLLLTSDIGFDTEKELLDAGADLRADVWVRGQHSESPTALPAFVDAIHPRVVISSHAEFPQSEQIPKALRKHLRDRQIPLFELGTSGSVSVEMGKDSLRVIPYAHPNEAVSLTRPQN